MQKQYFLYPQGVKTEVSEAVYKVYYQSRDREDYLKRRDLKAGLVSYHTIEQFQDEIAGEETIADTLSQSTEDVVELDIMSEKLNVAISQLTEEEKYLIKKIFFEHISDNKMAKLLGKNQSTITRSKRKILAKLKKLLEI